MRSGVVRGVSQIELNKGVIGAGKDYRAKAGVAQQSRQILGAERVEKVGVTAEQPGDCGGEVGGDAPDHAIEFGATTIVRRVRDDLHRGSFVPATESEASRSDRRRRRLSEPRNRNSLQLMRRKYQHLGGGVHKLRRQPLVKPEDGRQRIARRNGIDVRELGEHPSAKRRILVESECELHVVCGYRFPVVPSRARIDVKGK
jgi:hypothetical protein